MGNSRKVKSSIVGAGGVAHLVEAHHFQALFLTVLPVAFFSLVASLVSQPSLDLLMIEKRLPPVPSL
jgi:uncharacterized PurR-regulated membrane protein YhhQ (DUF165 family)